MAQRPTRAEIGMLGEQIAASFLMDRGYGIEMTNVVIRGGEIDIVASRSSGPVAFEVKTTSDGVDPVEALDQRKLEAFRRAVAGLNMPVKRLDVIAVTLTAVGEEVRWLRDVV